jgi:hypothetical protein
MAKNPDVQDLIAQREEISRKIAETEIPLLQSAVARMEDASTSALLADISKTAGQLDPASVSAQQLTNVMTVLSMVPVLLKTEIARLETLTNSAAAPTPVLPLMPAA